MGFRFRRTLKILPGVRLNLGKRGVSVSVGPRGAKITAGPDGVRGTVGLPGTGVSFTEKFGRRRRRTGDATGIPPERPRTSRPLLYLGWIVAVVLMVVLISVLV